MNPLSFAYHRWSAAQAESWRALIEIDLVVDLRVEPAALEHTNDVLAHEISLVALNDGHTLVPVNHPSILAKTIRTFLRT